MLLIVRTWRAVALNYSLTDIRIRTTDNNTYIHIYIYEKSTVQLTSVGLAQARPNNHRTV